MTVEESPQDLYLERDFELKHYYLEQFHDYHIKSPFNAKSSFNRNAPRVAITTDGKYLFDSSTQCYIFLILPSEKYFFTTK